MKEISIDTIKQMNVETFSKKANTPRGIETVSRNNVKIGDKVVIDNYFTLVTESWKSVE